MQKYSADMQTVQRRLVTLGITAMLGKRPGEVMPAGKVFFGTHIKVIMMSIVQYAVDGADGRDAERSRYKANPPPDGGRGYAGV